MSDAPEDSELDGLDPAELLDQEAARLSSYFRSLPESEWSRPSRCERWSVRDVLAHLTASEDYHHACLDGTVKEFIAGVAAKGAADLTAVNAMGISELSELTTDQLIDRWEQANADTRRRFRERGDGRVDTSVGDYPARWQAIHVASELATHADDVYVPVTAGERQRRRDWRARISRFALVETKPDLRVVATEGGTRVTGQGVDVTVDDDELIEAVAGRLQTTSLAPDVRAVLNATP